jgi:hypothetical protein
MRNLFTVLFLIFLGSSLSAQYAVNGVVVDNKTGEPLAFVNIQINNSSRGGSTDIDGKFSFNSNQPIKSLRLSYVGYERLTYKVEGKLSNLQLKMNRKAVELAEVEILPTENPANRILRKAIAHRDQNNYEKLEGFKYTAYEKMIFTVDQDSSEKKNASVADSLISKDTMPEDTSLREMKKFFAKRDLFLIENVVERSFMPPDRDVNKLTATRMSGLKDPVFVFVLSQLQTTTFYKDIFKIGDRSYVNPLTGGSLDRYFYQIEDTTYQGKDSTFIISFRPWKGTNFDGLKGVLYITTDGWAVSNVIAEPYVMTGGMMIRIQQKYSKPDSNHWFPLQLNTDIYFKNMVVQAGKGPNKKQVYIVAKGRTYIDKVFVGKDFPSGTFSMLGTDVDPRAGSRDETFWNKNRTDSLSLKNQETYRFIDSIGEKENFQRVAKIAETLMNGKIPWGWFDLPLDKFIKFNNFEGFRFGAGVETNEKFSRRFSINGSVAYGLKDKELKYSGGVSTTLYSLANWKAGYQFQHDVVESGSTRLPLNDISVSDPSFFRDIQISRMDYLQSNSVWTSFRALRHFHFKVALTSLTRSPFPEYSFLKDGKDKMEGTFHQTEVEVGFRFAFREKFFRTVRSFHSLGSDYPIVWVNYTRGVDNLLGGELAYDKVDVAMSRSFYTKFIGKTRIDINGGYATGSLPLGSLYNAVAASGNFTFFAPKSFSTMRMNEFYSDRYVALFFLHDFEGLLFKSKHFNPRPEVYFNALWGDMKHPEYHFGTQVKMPDKGYYEAGLNFNNLLNLKLYNLGLGGAWRFGPYSLPKTKDNLSVMLTFKWAL